jgi:Tol biopolymer transport system component
MKHNIVLLLVILFGAALSAVSPPQQPSTAEELLGAALHQEEVEGNLEAAVSLYRKFLDSHPKDRALAARAQFRLGVCYETLGREQARKAYEAVIREYADQTEFVARARERLAALPRSGGAGSVSRMTLRRVPELDVCAKPSPDGKYMSQPDWKTGNLAILEVATGAKRLLTKDGSWGEQSRYAEWSAWSGDSKRIAFTWNISDAKESRGEVRIVSPDGDSPPRTIGIPGSTYSWPVGFSPDGSRILSNLQVSRGSSQLALISVSNNEVEMLSLNFGAGRWLEYQFTDAGGSILYSYPSDGTAAPHDIYSRNLRTGETTAIVEHPAEDLLVGVLPGTDWLLFASDRRGRLDLWGVPFRHNRADGPPMLIKQGIGRFFPLGFTNDGRYYYATLSVTDDVFLADFDPLSGRMIGEPRKVRSKWEGANMGPSFSPDGESLAYVTKRGPMPIPTHAADSLVVQSLRDKGADPLVVGFDEFHLNSVHGPCWNADGRSMVLAGWQRDEMGLFRVDLPALRKTSIYSAPRGSSIAGHECASSGDFIYLISRGTGLPDIVARIDSDGRNERELFRAPEGQRIRSLALSPDDKVLSLIVHLDRDRRALLVMPSEGGTSRRIHEFAQRTGGGVSHTWSPDGKWIYYIVKEEEDWTWGIHRIPAEGGDTSETVYKGKGPFFALRFHLNGRMLAFTGRSGASTESEVWVIEHLKEELAALSSPPSGP